MLETAWIFVGLSIWFYAITPWIGAVLGVAASLLFTCYGYAEGSTVTVIANVLFIGLHLKNFMKGETHV